MTNSSSTSVLKSIAKERSLDKYGTLIAANVLIFAIQFILTSFATVSASGSLVIFIINQLISLIINILVGILVSGKAYLYMNLVYSQTISVSDIFFGFKQHPEKAVAIQALFVIVDFLVSIPAAFLFFLSGQYPSLNLDSIMIFALAVGIIINVYISLTYSQAFFILHDFPDRSAKEILETSKRLMKGNRLRLLYLHVSYIPLYILGVLTLFIPLLWISVYRYATVTVFYQDLISRANTSGQSVPTDSEQISD
jgi:uncharacterized membrane protein